MTAPVPAEVGWVLERGRQAHVAVVTGRGPHVTPELCTWSDGRLWFWFATSTLKARTLTGHPRAAAMVTVDGRSAIVRGQVDLFDPTRPLTWLSSPCRGLRAGRAAARYGAGHLPDLAGFVDDLARGRLGRRPPPLRILAALEPDEAFAVDAGALGADDPGDAVVAAFPGPAIAPGRWQADRDQLLVAPALLDRFHITGETTVAVVADEDHAPGPAAKEGLLVRGRGERRGRSGALDVVADTVTAWQGVEMATTPLGGS